MRRPLLIRRRGIQWLLYVVLLSLSIGCFAVSTQRCFTFKFKFKQSDIYAAYNATHGRTTHLRGIRRIPSHVYTTQAITTQATPIVEDNPISIEQRHHTVKDVAPTYYQERHLPTPPSFPIAVAPQASVPSASVSRQIRPLLGMKAEDRREV